MEVQVWTFFMRQNPITTAPGSCCKIDILAPGAGHCFKNCGNSVWQANIPALQKRGRGAEFEMLALFLAKNQAKKKGGNIF
ncbi:MAG: hypothetical protein HY842_19270 [Bacteroidetes bacterium]|nr:hypothetical protein [Bacteroidota bacterium]